jgi:DNA modification methylase
MQIKNRIKELRQVKASELLPNPRNWRKHPTSQADALRGALAEIGYADALIAYETDDGLMLIDGHLRAETTPDMEVPVLVTDLDESEANKLLMTLDPLSAMASADTDTFDALRQMTTVENDALQDMLDAITEGNLKSLESSPKPKVGLTDPDEVPPEPEEPWVQMGDLFQLGSHRLLCGDATSADDVAVLLGDRKIDMVFTDPPYNVDYSSKNELLNLWDNGKRIQTPITNDNHISDKEYADFCQAFYLTLEPYMAKVNSIYICGNYESLIHYYKLSNLKISNMLVWVKSSLVIGRMDYQNQHEFILYGWSGTHKWYSDRKQSTVWEFPKPSRSSLHPTMKPVELVERGIINSSDLESLVYDAFCGSGSTLIAAERLSRTCYGMEIDPKYVQVTIERWQNYTGQKAVKL